MSSHVTIIEREATDGAPTTEEIQTALASWRAEIHAAGHIAPQLPDSVRVSTDGRSIRIEGTYLDA